MVTLIFICFLYFRRYLLRIAQTPGTLSRRQSITIRPTGYRRRPAHQVFVPMYFVVVHGGAGNHPTSDTQIKKALRLACREALSRKPSALEAVSLSISVLEDEECFNAGYGSNLTYTGQVECDASIINDQGEFGSVGSVSGVANPIKLAYTVLQHSRLSNPLGRVPPLTLVSHGAHIFAEQKGFPTCSPDSLVSPRSKNDWEKWKSRLEQSDLMQDTVGAVVWDLDDHLAAGVSSGGLLLKYPGRIGEAAVYGAGCWAESRSGPGIACSISGCGEQIIRASLAQHLSEELFASFSEEAGFDTHSILERVITERFIKSCGSSDPQAGLVLLTKEQNSRKQEGYTVRLWCAFTTASMAMAYASTYDPKPKALILRRPRSFVNSVFITSLPLSRI